jgi:flavin reductase (DIM6/NTAB) family NADH-FMN oxidoreductase RutF
MPEPPLNQALRLLTYGVYVITTAREGREEAFLTPWLSQVSLQPPTLALSVPPASPAHELLAGGAPFVVNILKAGQKTIADAFAEPPGGEGALRGRPTSQADNGCPYLSEALAIIECEPAGRLDTGRGGTIVVGSATSATLLAEGQPLTLRQTGMDPLGM